MSCAHAHTLERCLEVDDNFDSLRLPKLQSRHLNVCHLQEIARPSRHEAVRATTPLQSVTVDNLVSV